MASPLPLPTATWGPATPAFPSSAFPSAPSGPSASPSSAPASALRTAAPARSPASASAPFSSGPPSAPSAWVPQHHRDITLGRLDGYLADGQFADVSLRAELWARRCSDSVRLHVYSHPKDLPYPPYEQAVRMPYHPAQVGDKFGPSWTTHWFRVLARVPQGWDGEGPLMFRWDSGCEAMLYSDGPTPRQGITAQRNEYRLADRVVGGQELLFYVELAANGMFGNGPTENNIQAPDENRYFELKTAELAIPNLPVTALFHDLRALTGLARELPPGNVTGETALYVANKMINTYRPRDPASVEAARALAASVLARRDPADRMQVYAVGHCHIDTAWLWPFSETHRKTARSWSAQLRLSERFPWHVFTASSAQQYEWLLADYPGLFAEIQAAAKRGSFVPVGGTWVEMDTNLPSGESLVRQFLFGQRFFEANFGARCDVFWLPDTFGYSGQLPQLANGAGIRYFLTQKLSWNNINAFPHSTFQWAGLDGSTVLTHFPPANTYNAQADAHDILATATGSKDKDRAPAAYMLYGNGDGGGGPTPDMCESLARLAGCRGLASLALASPGDFFRCLEASSRDLLTWRGELYFELHRGTYTSHAANKSDNRTCELLLREVELAGALAAAVLPPGAYCYPRSEVEAIWKDVLLYQFHDVLPGSAIGRVYDVTAVRYPQMMSTLRRMRDAALAALLASTTPPTPIPTPAAAAAAPAAAAPLCEDASIQLFSDLLIAGAKPLPPPPGAAAVPGAVQIAAGALAAPPVAWAFNSLAFRRREVVAVPAAALPPGGGGGAVRQWCADGAAALVVVEAAPLSLTPITVGDLAAGATAAAAAAPAWGLAAPAAAGGLRSLPLEAAGGVSGRAGAGAAAARADPWVGAGATCTAVPRGEGGGAAAPGSGEGLVYLMQNSMIRAAFDDRGRLLSLFDFAWQRELVPEGAAGNVFRLYEDIPLFWDAWDIEIYHLEKGWPAGEGMAPPEVAILESGPLRCRLQLTMQLSPTSSLKQIITMTAVSPRLDFHLEVDWHESRRALKVEFPWALDAPAATYEVQYGAVQRPTHTNTSWDWARFEVCAHKWADLSEPGYGVALLNDCKYGHATHGNVVRLSLLRSPKAPDAHTDIGAHAMRFALLPHALDWTQAGVAAHGWAFNAPMRILKQQPPPTAPGPPAGGALAAAAGGSGAGARVGGGRGGATPEGVAYEPSQPMFVVTSARPSPLAPAAAAAAAAAPPALTPPPLILDTIKLPEPPLQRRAPDQPQPHQHQHPHQHPHPHPHAAPHPFFNPGPGAAAAGLFQAAASDPPGAAAAGAAAAAAAAAASASSSADAPPAAVVLRLYEPHGARGVARVAWPAWLPVARVVACNLLEDDEDDEAEGGAEGARGGDAGLARGAGQGVGPGRGAGRGQGGGVRLAEEGGAAEVPYGPFKVITLKLYLRQQG